MNRIILIIFSIALGSCASILNSRTYNLEVYSDIKKSIVKIYDTIYNLPNEIKVRRSNKDLELKLITNNREISYKVKTSPSPTFLYWNLVGL